MRLALCSTLVSSARMSIQSALKISSRPARAFVIIGLYWGAFAAQVPVLKSQLGASDGMFGILLLGSAVGLVSAMWLAPKADAWLGPRGMQIGALMFALCWLLPGLATSPAFFAASILLVGMSSGLLDVVMNARVSDLEASSGRSLMNVNHAMFSVGYAIAALLTGIAREVGLPPVAVFALLGVAILPLIPGLHLQPAKSDHDDSRAGQSPMPLILLCGAIVLIAFMSEATVEAWSALHIERTLHGGAAEGALGPATLGLTMAIGRFSGQLVAERLRETTVVIWASMLSAVGAVIAATALSPAMAYLGFGVMGLGVSVIGPMGLALVGKLVAPQHRTQAISRVAVIGFSGFFMAPVVMGLASEAFGLRWAYCGVAVFLLTAIPIARHLRR